MKKFIPYILILIALGIFAGYYMYNKPHAETQGAKADITINPADLLAAFELDETKANAMYLDKIIEVKGKVKSINEVEQGGSISLDTGNEISSVICEFEHAASIDGVKVGDEVIIKGFCSGKLMDVILVRCSL
ncbi:MAG: hypothetical protein H7X99_09560 [Saprospiraceae bacterium]|nr:hypothetical protein [Saprospiraceae bacterium]